MPEQRIHVLDKAVAERIAAGEIVERPSAVVKELIENSIDAGATAIAAEIREGGLDLVRVSDNGSGMSREDAALSVARFATSKINTADDLNAIRTLGFRGEALPSIATVSQLELLTRARDQIEGTQVRVSDGQASVDVAGAPIGTRVTVRGLFYNAPARKKFVKAPFREAELVIKTVTSFALAYPLIAFRLVVDGREALALPPSNLLVRLGGVWGRDVAAEMVEIRYSGLDLNISGYISRPSLARASREWQSYYVNGRPIRSGLLAVMLERPYLGRIPPNRHPLAIIQIELDPRTVDVNIHPRKAEVRFYQERAVYGAIAQAVQDALREFPAMVQPSVTEWPFASVVDVPGAPVIAHESAVGYALDDWRAVAQLHNTYVLASSREGMVIVDQHAAHEQILYEALTATGEGIQEEGLTLTARDTAVGVGSRVIQVTPAEAGLLGAHLEEYQGLGISLEPFGENAFRLDSLPPFVHLPPERFLALILEEHARYRDLAGESLRDRLAAKVACLSAIKAGDPLGPSQQQALLDRLLRAFAPATCPHGRPVFVRVGMEELDRRFLRR